MNTLFNKVLGENENCVFAIKTEQIFWLTQYADTRRKCKKKKKKNRRYPDWKEGNKTFSTCRQHACLCCKYQGMYKNHLELISEFRKMAGYKVTVQMYFYMLMTFKWKPKLKIPYRIAPKK